MYCSDSITRVQISWDVFRYRLWKTLQGKIYHAINKQTRRFVKYNVGKQSELKIHNPANEKRIWYFSYLDEHKASYNLKYPRPWATGRRVPAISRGNMRCRRGCRLVSSGPSGPWLGFQAGPQEEFRSGCSKGASFRERVHLPPRENLEVLVVKRKRCWTRAEEWYFLFLDTAEAEM